MVLRARAEEGLVGMDMCNGVERWLRLFGVSGPQGISGLAYEEEFVLIGDHEQEAVSVTVLPCRFAWGHFGLETALLPLRRRFASLLRSVGPVPWPATRVPFSCVYATWAFNVTLPTHLTNHKLY